MPDGLTFPQRRALGNLLRATGSRDAYMTYFEEADQAPATAATDIHCSSEQGPMSEEPPTAIGAW